MVDYDGSSDSQRRSRQKASGRGSVPLIARTIGTMLLLFSTTVNWRT